LYDINVVHKIFMLFLIFQITRFFAKMVHPKTRLSNQGYHTQEITRFSDQYYLGKTLLSGKFTSVAVGTNKKTNKKVIVKSVYSTRYRKLKEANILKKLVNVPGVITYLDQFNLNYCNHLLVMEYFGDMTLKRYIYNYKNLSETLVHTIFKQLVAVVQTCYNLNIFHRKIRCSNILIDQYSHKIKLMNFNSASQFDDNDEEFNTELCTDIAPPEYFTIHSYTVNSMYVWTLGLVLYEMLYSQQPFLTSYNVVHTQHANHSNILVSIDVTILLSWMLTKLPSKRINFYELIHHPWITKKWL